MFASCLDLIHGVSSLPENGVITFDEFVQMVETQQLRRNAQPPEKRVENEEAMWKMFKMFDKNDDGFINRDEMNALVKELSLGKDFPRHVVDQMFRDADTNGDGRISFSG